MNFGVILAGGSGSRMGATDKPKQYLEIDKKPIIVHTVEKFVHNENIEAIFVMCPSEWIEYTEKLCKRYLFGGKIFIQCGGMNRNETILNAINAIENTYGLNDKTILITHDGVRPFVNQKIIEENIRLVSNGKVCTTAIPATDTIFISKDGSTVDRPLDREFCYQVQTPQSFFAMEFKKCYNRISDDQKEKVTDAMGVFLLNNYEVFLIPGRTENIKITYPSDLHIAKKIFEMDKTGMEF